MDDIFSDVERVMAALCEPLGDCAPRRRRLVADYKDSDGNDLHQDLVTWHHKQATDAALVQSIREALTGSGCTLTALGELLEGGGTTVLYMAAGVHPVNWEELTHGG